MSRFNYWILSFFAVYGLIIKNTHGNKESVRSNDQERDCMSVLMATKYLKNSQFSASSYSSEHDPSAARMVDVHSQSDSADTNAWCPKNPVHKKTEEWIQIDFRRMTVIKSIYTMGGNGYSQFTPEILIEYQRSNHSRWITYIDKHNKTVLEINKDARTKERLSLHTIIARRIRIYPLNTRTGPMSVCLKFALLGCFMDDEVTSYSAPQGDLISINHMNFDFRDHYYDGDKSQTLTNGIGLLMDNNAWIKHFELNPSELKNFIGWSCGGPTKRSHISMEFNFDEEREFSRLVLFSMQDITYNIIPSLPIIISIGQHQNYSQIVFNENNFKMNVGSSGIQIIIPLHKARGNTCRINITCGSNNIILLSEIKIESEAAKSIRNNVSNRLNQPTLHYSNTSDKYATTDVSDNQLNNSHKQQDITAIVLAILIVLLLIFFIGMAVLCYQFQRSKRNKLTKKLEIVAQRNTPNMYNQNPGTVYTIQSKTPTTSTFQQPKFYGEMKSSYSAAYSGSQPSDGVYASWPNTDEDADVATIDKEEEKCLLSAEVGDRTSLKEYATYQCGINPSSTNDYILTDGSTYKAPIKTRPSSISTTLPNPSTLSVPLLKIVTSYETPKPTPVVTYRSIKRNPGNVDAIPFQHLLTYRGTCGDVDLRYQSAHLRMDQNNLESNIKVIPTSSLIPIQPLLRGEYGSVTVCKILTDSDPQAGNCFFVKSINTDSKSSIKSSYIVDFKILSSISSSNVAKLDAIAIDNDTISSDFVTIIKSTRFFILIDHPNGRNLKEFLRNLCYSKMSQDFKCPQQISYSQINVSNLLSIITQISSGMKHLEDLNVTHRDLACRNCVIDLRMHVKIYPGGLVTTKANEDYCSIEIKNHLVSFPLRWMAPESINAGCFSIKSDVWSFGVTLWEIFTLCSLIPYGSLTNEALLELMSHRNNTPKLPCPQHCPKEIFDVMNQCWNWDESMRPKFVDIHKFLQIKTSNSSNQAQIILPAPPPDDRCS